MNLKANIAAVAFIASLLIARPSKADTVAVTLDLSSLTGPPSSSVTFTGTIQNSSGAEVFLNGAEGTLTYPELTFDFTPFFTFTPLSIPDGQSYDGLLFAVAISGVALPGDYPGNTFYIQGGPDSSTFDTISTVEFEISVGSTDVPEPGSVRLMSAILVLAMLSKRRIRKDRSRPTLGF